MRPAGEGGSGAGKRAPAEGLAVALYRAALVSYPCSFRRDHRADVVDVFRDLYRARYLEAGARGAIHAVAFALPRAFAGGCRERWGSRRAGPARAEAAAVAADLRYAVRSLTSRPALTCVVAGLLGVGIGISSAFFGILRGVLVPLPYPGAERMVSVEVRLERAGWTVEPKATTVLELRARARALARIEARAGDRVLLAEPEPQRLSVVRATPGLLDAMGVAPAAGRGFLDSDIAPQATPVALLSRQFWRRELDADPDVLGRTLMLDGIPHVVVGVLPELAPGRAAVWLPLDLGTSEARVNAYAWLHSGATLEQAREELAANPPQSERDDHEDAILTLRATRGAIGSQRSTVLLLGGAASALLLLACANAANLLLARGVTRRREIAVRAALGAGRGRIARQLLLEGVLTSLVAGALGLLLATWSLRAAAAAPTAVALNLLSAARIDSQVLMWTLALSVATGVLFGLLPAIRAARPRLTAHLYRVGSAAGGPGARTTGGVLIAAEVALSLMLLAIAGLLTRSLLELEGMDPGFEVEGLVSFNVTLPGDRYPEASGRYAFWGELQEAVGGMAPVKRVALALTAPPIGLVIAGVLEVAERSEPADEGFQASINEAGPGFFRTLGIPILAGRGFLPEDTAAKPLPMVISQSMARRYWPDADPVGARVRITLPGMPDSPWQQIVGVAGDVALRGVRELAMGPGMQVYLPFGSGRAAGRTGALILRSDVPAAAMAAELKRQVWARDPELPVEAMEDVTTSMAGTLAMERFLAVLMTLFAALALSLGIAGVFAVVSYAVGRRTHEIGVRIALGAGEGAVRRLVIRQALLPVGVGVAAGLAAAVASSRLIGSLLYGIGPGDPVTLLSTTGLVLLAALAAAWLPARRAARVDPVIALRAE